MKDFVILKTVNRSQGNSAICRIHYAETAWTPGECIAARVKVDGIQYRTEPKFGKDQMPDMPSEAVEHFNWCVRAFSVGEPPAADKIQLWQLNDLREAAGLPRGPEIPRKGAYL
jgi:hypothetical protein